MRNLPAFARTRKALAVALWVAGGAGWALAVWLPGEAPAPRPELEVGGAGLATLWDEACPPVVASARGKRYYWAWCEAAGTLKPGNLRHFCGPEEAERAGFSPAQGCVLEAPEPDR